MMAIMKKMNKQWPKVLPVASNSLQMTGNLLQSHFLLKSIWKFVHYLLQLSIITRFKNYFFTEYAFYTFQNLPVTCYKILSFFVIKLIPNSLQKSLVTCCKITCCKTHASFLAVFTRNLCNKLLATHHTWNILRQHSLQWVKNNHFSI